MTTGSKKMMANVSRSTKKMMCAKTSSATELVKLQEAAIQSPALPFVNANLDLKVNRANRCPNHAAVHVKTVPVRMTSVSVSLGSTATIATHVELDSRATAVTPAPTDSSERTATCLVTAQPTPRGPLQILPTDLASFSLLMSECLKEPSSVLPYLMDNS